MCRFQIVLPYYRKPQTELIKWPSATQLAQILCRIERKLAKHVGPEEFIQCSSTILASRQVCVVLRVDACIINKYLNGFGDRMEMDKKRESGCRVG